HLASRSLSTTRRPPRRSTLFPYTTLFRSPRGAALAVRVEEVGAVHASAGATDLPVPDVGVRPWKTASVCHCANHLPVVGPLPTADRKSTRLNSSHVKISYAVFCLKKKTKK